MAQFEIPLGAMPDPVPAAPPPDPAMAREQAIADNTRAEEALNGFIAAKQHALFEAPDAFYRTEGSDAIHAAPAILDTLSKLRDDHLAGLANDAQRDRLAPALDAHMDLARDDISRHVAEQSQVWQRQVAQDRIALLTKEAAYHHNVDGLVDAIGHAAATAARAHARVGDGLDQQGEDTAAATARSGVLGAAIRARLDRGDTEGANALFTRVQDQLDPAHAMPLKAGIEGRTVEANPDVHLAQYDQADTTPFPPYMGQRPEQNRSQSGATTSGSSGTFNVEPPRNDPEFRKDISTWRGEIVVLPDHSPIVDLSSPTGYLMSPFSDLSDVAAAGRNAGQKMRAKMLVGPVNAATVVESLRDDLKRTLDHGGSFYYQRRVDDKDPSKFMQLPQFRNVSNVNVGLFMQQAGIPLPITLTVAGLFAFKYSNNYRPDEEYGLDPQTREFIENGYKIGERGLFNPGRGTFGPDQ